MFHFSLIIEVIYAILGGITVTGQQLRNRKQLVACSQQRIDCTHCALYGASVNVVHQNDRAVAGIVNDVPIDGICVAGFPVPGVYRPIDVRQLDAVEDPLVVITAGGTPKSKFLTGHLLQHPVGSVEITNDLFGG